MSEFTRKVLFEKFDKPDITSSEHGFNYSYWRRKDGSLSKCLAISNHFKAIEFLNTNGVHHRDNDEPAYIATYDNQAGEIRFYQNGKLHRGIFKPAVVHLDGREEYYVFGEKRFETKAIVSVGGYKSTIVEEKIREYLG